MVGKRYKEMDFWIRDFGFSMSPLIEKNANANDATNTLPRKLQQCEKDWKNPTRENPLKIGVQSRTSFENFVKVEHGVTPNENNYTGFCFQFFFKVIELLGHPLYHKFEAFNGTCNELIHLVYNEVTISLPLIQ